jgi:prepilin-type N-terminal cleavage/methylation domain-containing protein
MSRLCLRSGQQGFALAELLVASVILASAGALLAGGLLWANRSIEARAQRAHVTQLLASRLSLLEETLTTQEPQAGLFDPPIEGAAWQLELQPVDGTDGVLQRVMLTVTQGGQAASVVTYRPIAEAPDEG